MPSTKTEVRVLASPEQQARWSEAARRSGRSLSSWLAGLADAGCEVEPAPALPPVAAPRPPVVAAVREPVAAPQPEVRAPAPSKPSYEHTPASCPRRQATTRSASARCAAPGVTPSRVSSLLAGADRPSVPNWGSSRQTA
jgi:hypothetical protein